MRDERVWAGARPAPRGVPGNTTRACYTRDLLVSRSPCVTFGCCLQFSTAEKALKSGKKRRTSCSLLARTKTITIKQTSQVAIMAPACCCGSINMRFAAAAWAPLKSGRTGGPRVVAMLVVVSGRKLTFYLAAFVAQVQGREVRGSGTGQDGPSLPGAQNAMPERLTWASSGRLASAWATFSSARPAGRASYRMVAPPVKLNGAHFVDRSISSGRVGAATLKGRLASCNLLSLGSC